MTPEELAAAVLAAVRAAVDAGELAVSVPDSAVVERPKSREHGDYATNVALRLAKPAGRPPREVAELIAARLREHAGIARVDVAGPGFLNVTLAKDALAGLVRTVVETGPAYGRGEVNAGRHLNLEYVSANPTGPLHLAHARWAATGDSLARLLVASGAEVTREYYFNDAGAQIDRFTASLVAAATGQPTPQGGYGGDYIEQIATAVVAANPGVLDEPEEKRSEVFRSEGIELMLASIKRSLADFGAEFDVYFSERTLHVNGEIDEAVTRLREQGHVYEADGALWLHTSEFGDDKDRVLVRSDGRPTYFNADCAYYLDKRRRGADRLVYLLGADHHGYVGRLRAIAAAFGDDPDQTVEVIIGQLVSLHGGRMSKRAGNLVTLDEGMRLIGTDALRYALVRWSMDSPIDIDVELWAARTNDNPVFYVQYAHARLASLGRNARELGVSLPPLAEIDYGLLSHEREGDLLRALGEFPRVAAAAAELRAPHRVARYLEELAGTYHRFYDVCRVLPSEHEDSPGPALVHARLALCEATRIVLENGLGLIGVSAPDRM
ncbi:MAG TPA: arginine--tRNA ligase [Mycobacteriales bacterium]|nr:arginine--tRNA ligase [Mycobacteriales bacterium]